MPSIANHERPHGRRQAVRRAIVRVATVAVAFSALAIAAASNAGSAWGNEYSGMLKSGTLSMANPGTSITGWGYGNTSSSTDDPVSANATFANDSWTAPSGTQFEGFAYTAAWFESITADPTGALSIGFVGSGGNAPTDLNFPWTQDCAVTEQDSPREWVTNRKEPGTDSGYSQYCETNGNTSGWNYTNVEIESLAPSVNPQVPYSTLSLRGWCARDNTCSGYDTAAAQVANLSAVIGDPNNQPTGSGAGRHRSTRTPGTRPIPTRPPSRPAPTTLPEYARSASSSADPAATTTRLRTMHPRPRTQARPLALSSTAPNRVEPAVPAVAVLCRAASPAVHTALTWWRPIRGTGWAAPGCPMRRRSRATTTRSMSTTRLPRPAGRPPRVAGHLAQPRR